jgi:hypothetical protein
LIALKRRGEIERRGGERSPGIGNGIVGIVVNNFIVTKVMIHFDVIINTYWSITFRKEWGDSSITGHNLIRTKPPKA